MPDNHHCVVLTWAPENHLAPCPIGRQDLEENLFLHKDMFYAVPSSMLKRFTISIYIYSMANMLFYHLLKNDFCLRHAEANMQLFIMT